MCWYLALNSSTEQRVSPQAGCSSTMCSLWTSITLDSEIYFIRILCLWDPGSLLCVSLKCLFPPSWARNAGCKIGSKLSPLLLSQKIQDDRAYTFSIFKGLKFPFSPPSSTLRINQIPFLKNSFHTRTIRTLVQNDSDVGSKSANIWYSPFALLCLARSPIRGLGWC